MYRITTRDLILTVADNWSKQYSKGPYWNLKDHGKEIWEKLNSLDLKIASSDEVNSIIGNNSWTQITCNECESEVNEAIVFEPLSGMKVKVCEECLKNALIILKGKAE